jgi:phenylalanyl-tRNA synthetase alpha chain
MVIDKGINLTHFKQVINEILSAIFETQVNLRMRPAFFPFVEPGFEIDASCPICKGKGCSLCKKT